MTIIIGEPMSRTIRKTALATSLLAVFAISAFAQSNSPPVAPAHAGFFQHMLQKMDTNGDGRISLDEYLAAASTQFKSIDTKNKGSIDAADLASSPQAMERIDHRAEAMVRRLDTAGNGYVTQDEFVAAAQKRFTRLDKNGDGKLTPDELTGRWAHGGNAATKGSGQTGKSTAERFDKLDTNHDGVVTMDEYVAAATALFHQFDTAGDGQVTAAEIEAAPKTQQRVVNTANRMIKHMDTNGDGSVSLDEYLAAAKTRFAKIDKNGDGYIDADEVGAGHRWAGKGHQPDQS
jgi:Ca2+-binding EF-hand superfamily protein